METKSCGNTSVVETPEIQKVMAILDKEIHRLKENISALTTKLSGILIQERPIEDKGDRLTRECQLAEDIQKNIDAVSKSNDLIDELQYRTAL